MSNTIENKQSQPFIRLFKSPRQFYVYSVNKDCVKDVSENVYRYLDGDDTAALSEDEQSELEALRDDGFLSPKRLKEIRHPELDGLEHSLESRMDQLILQVTQACNLTCSYCPYANKTDGKLQRNHTDKCMSVETAKRAVDFFLEHSGDKRKSVVSFYGGEPLISFDLIREIVQYAREKFLGKEIRFSMTTNATLFTEEMMDFVAENKFDILFSIDGPAKIHDINRRRADGSGSFADAFANLKRIMDKYGKNAAEHISINMVLNPANDPDDVIELFDDPIFDKGINVSADLADDAHLEKPMERSDTYIEKMNYLYFLGYLDYFKIVDGLKIPPFMASAFVGMEKDCADLKEEGTGVLPDIGAPGGPCVPGQRRVFVSVDGQFYPCEKVSELSEAMKIGSLDMGFDYKKAEALLDVASLTAEKCKNCWAFQHCVLCARFSDDEGVLSKEMRESCCGKTYSSFSNLIEEFILMQECKTTYKRGE